MKIDTMKAKKILKDLYSYCDKSQSYFHDLGYDFKETDFDLLFTIVYLLNDQIAENDKLREENAKQKAMLEYVEDEMMPLPFENDFDKAIKSAKVEAVKEFVNMLKEKKGWEISDYIFIENLAKEMEEELNNV